MDNLKFALTSIMVLAMVGLLGYWAVTSMQSGSDHINVQKIKALQAENEELKQETAKLKSELSLTQAPSNIDVKPAEKPQPEVPAPVKKPTTTTYKNQTLINELQKLADKGVVLKLKSASPAVGTVQKFLNIYNKTSNKIDNDYGASTKTAVAAFQKAQGLPSSGEAGKATFTKMIAWLKKQG